MHKITLYREILGDIFHLKFPVLVVRKSRIIWPGRIDCWGLYEGEWVNKKLKHKILYNYRTSDEVIFQTLCHEYVHAWQMERDLELEHDSPEFLNWDCYFKNHWGFSLFA
jgi:hypothetical protein